MEEVMTWSAEDVGRLAAAAEIDVVPDRRDGTRGRGTRIWCVVVDGRVFLRSWNGADGAWYRAAIARGSGRVRAAGVEDRVGFASLTDRGLDERIDAAYRTKYAGSAYLPPMIGAGPRAATVEVTPRGG